MPRFPHRGRRWIISLLAVVVLLAAASLWADRIVRNWQVQYPHSSAPKTILPRNDSQNPSRDTDFDPATASANQLLQAAIDACAQVDDYHCTSHSTNLFDGKLEKYTIDITFRRPALFRHTIVEGANKGTVLAKGPDGQIHVRPGGVLGLLVVDMPPNDKRLLDGRGIPFYQSDWSSDLARLNDRAKSGGILTRLPDQEQSGSQSWVLELALAPPAEERTRVWIDPQTRLLKRISTFRGEKLLRDAVYTVLSLNDAPPDSYFKLK